MDIISKSQEMSTLIGAFKKERNMTMSSLSNVDKKISNYQHLMECCKFPAHIRAKINKEYDNLLDQRRELKVKVSQLDYVQARVVKYEPIEESGIAKRGSFKFLSTGFTEAEMECYSKYVRPEFK